MMGPDDLRRLAATFVLGTLDGEERAQARARRAEDAEFAALVRVWEDRLAPLHVLSPAVRPPEGLWADLLAALPVPEPVPETVPAGEARPAALNTPPDASGDGAEAAVPDAEAHAFPLSAEEQAPPSGAPEAPTADPDAFLLPDAPEAAQEASTGAAMDGPPLLPAEEDPAAWPVPLAPSPAFNDTPSPEAPAAAPFISVAPLPEAAPAPTGPEAAEASPLAPPDGAVLPPAEAVSPVAPSWQDPAGAGPGQSGPADEGADASAAEGSQAAPDQPAEPQPAFPSGGGEGGEPFPAVSAPPDEPRPDAPPPVAPLAAPEPPDAGKVEPGGAEPLAAEPPAAEPLAAERPAPAASAPRGPFDIVLDRPAPTGREGPALPRGEHGSETGNPWRLTTGLLLVAGLIGGAAIAYRETHRQPPPPDVFAPLKSSPHPQMVLALDPEAGDVVVRQLDEAPPEGMVYRMWLVSHTHGTRALCTFTAVGRCPAGALGAVDRAGLMAGVLQVTLEPAGLSLSTPTGKVVYHGRALTR